METKTISKQNEKEFDTVKIFREIKENISNEIWGLSYEELMEYFENPKQNVIFNKHGIVGQWSECKSAVV